MPAPDAAVGHILGGRYTVVGVMGRAARVITYEAVSAPSRQVVVKLYDPALRTQALATLRAAEGITRDLPRGSALEVLEVGVDGGSGAAMVVTERSARPSLAHLVQLCPLSPVESASLARSLARALSAAHERGLAHLGLKATNVFVGPAPGCDVQLADFGSTLARATPGEGGIDVLDLPWLAPEQAFGGAVPSALSDVFSAALVVFFALTGRSYWRSGAGPVDPAAWTHEVRSPRASAAARAAELGQPLDGAWDSVFARALDLDPARRQGSIAELADDFERASRGERVETQPPASVRPPARLPEPPPTRAQAPTFVITSRASPTPWIVGGIAGLLALAALWVAVVRFAPRTIHAATKPVAPAPSGPAVWTSASSSATASTTAPLSATPAPPPAPSSAPSASQTPGPVAPVVPAGRALLVVTCNPSCDSVWVDGHPAADVAQGHPMQPGVHQVGANLARHPSKIQAVLLRGGQVTRLDVDFTR